MVSPDVCRGKWYSRVGDFCNVHVAVVAECGGSQMAVFVATYLAADPCVMSGTLHRILRLTISCTERSRLICQVQCVVGFHDFSR